MALAISAVSPAPPVSINIAPASVARAAATPAAASGVTAAVRPAATTAAAPSGQQRAALNQLLSKYQYAQSHNAAASTVSALGKQILAEAKTLGQHVTLPRAPASAPAAVATPATAQVAAPVAAPAPSAPAATGRVSITA